MERGKNRAIAAMRDRKKERTPCPCFHLEPPGASRDNFPPQMDIIAELQWRGLLADCTDLDALSKRLASPTTLYCGFDPTSDSLHVGNLVPLLALRRFQIAGHNPIAVAGGATGCIGDPSGKTDERQLLTREMLEHNIASIKQQLGSLLDFETKTNPAQLVDNASWT